MSQANLSTLDHDQEQLTTSVRLLSDSGHRFTYRCDAGKELELLMTVMRHAADVLHPLDWFEAATIAHELGRRHGRQMLSRVLRRSAKP
jgi:hypothetical protein